MGPGAIVVARAWDWASGAETELYGCSMGFIPR